MIKHVVMFKLKDFPENEKSEIVKILKSKLEKLPDFIEVIKSFEVGINVLKQDRAYDFVLVSEFESLETLEIYRVHPKHVEFREFLWKYRDNSVSVDYEF